MKLIMILLICLLSLLPCAIGHSQSRPAEQALTAILPHFVQPPMDCWPNTRWWWFGSAVTREEITWELQQMHDHGISGVEQISMNSVYEKGNIPYLSDQFMEMLTHTVHTAKSLGMKVSINFGGPGWIIGGDWVAQNDRMKNMVPTFLDLQGPQHYMGLLSAELPQTSRSWESHEPRLAGDEQLLAVVAGRVSERTIDKASLINLTAKTKDGRLDWQVPEGTWRVMAFWLKYTRQGGAVDHFSKEAMQRYCEYLGGKFFQAFGDEFGKTVDSFFCDSFELSVSSSGMYWSDSLLQEFQKRKGYDLTNYLPAIWWQVDDITPKIRFDVNEFLHQIGLEAFYDTFLQWCERHNVQGRIQTYGFASDNIESAGRTHIPELEITPGEKDAVPWFDTRIGPREYVASGAHLYGRNIVTVEAYTYLHWEPYRDTLEELKIASDGFLCAGANKFYNAGYDFSPERQAAPARAFGCAEAAISHVNVWWPHYPLLAKYISRCCYLLRQGDFVADIAVYSPLANQWSLNALNARKWTREFAWGDLGGLLIANGYRFDLLNDDVLLRRAQVLDGQIQAGAMRYKILILPNVACLPLETMLFVRDYAQAGGIVIALERAPQSSVGMADYLNKDRQVRAIADELFRMPAGDNDTGHHSFGRGQTYYIKQVLDRSDVLDRRSSMLDPFVNTLRQHVTPDMTMDFAQAGLRQNNGLHFNHRKTSDLDIYFVSNIQDQPFSLPLTFRIKNKIPWSLNPYDGSARRLYVYREKQQGIEIPVTLAPYESTFFVFSSGKDTIHVEESTLYRIGQANAAQLEGFACENGDYANTLLIAGRRVTNTVHVQEVPAPYMIAGEWKLNIEDKNFPACEKRLFQLQSWTEDSTLRHFSGSGRYQILFQLPQKYIAPDLRLELDLGSVGKIASVLCNDKPVGVVWMRGQRLDVSKALHVGYNLLVIEVTNTLINRFAGMKESPPVPEELVAHYGSASRAYPYTRFSPFGFKALPLSGLVGPVQIIPIKKIGIGWEK
jgi:hypothetical protein